MKGHEKTWKDCAVARYHTTQYLRAPGISDQNRIWIWVGICFKHWLQTWRSTVGLLCSHEINANHPKAPWVSLFPCFSLSWLSWSATLTKHESKSKVSMIVKKSPIQDLHGYHACLEFLNALPQAFLSITLKEKHLWHHTNNSALSKSFKHAARLAQKAALKPCFPRFLSLGYFKAKVFAQGLWHSLRL